MIYERPGIAYDVRRDDNEVDVRGEIMGKLVEDIRDMSVWRRCRRRREMFEVSYDTSGAVYTNSIDSSLWTAKHNTPILLRDANNNYWTLSVDTFKEIYVTPSGDDITEDFVQSLRVRDFLPVRARAEKKFWAFHVKVSVYGYACKYGANKLDKPHGDGDYLLSAREDAPDLDSLVLVSNVMFTRLYEIIE